MPVALRAGEQRLSFGALGEVTGYVASGLARAGVGRGDLVPVGVESPLATVVAALGAMRAGSSEDRAQLRVAGEHTALCGYPELRTVIAGGEACPVGQLSPLDVPGELPPGALRGSSAARHLGRRLAALDP